MKFITIRDFRGNTAAVRKDLEKEKELVLTANGRPFAILSQVGPDTVEEELMIIRRARARFALEHIRTQAKRAGTAEMTMSDIDQVVAAAHRGQRTRSRGTA